MDIAYKAWRMPVQAWLKAINNKVYCNIQQATTKNTYYIQLP